MKPRTPLAPLLALLAAGALLASGCGEKSEPDLDDLGTPTRTGLADQIAQLEAAGDDSPGPLEGTWSGTLNQRGQKSFPITVTIASLSDPAKNPVRYGGSIDCAGTWDYAGGEGDKVEFTEVIDSGAGGNCKGRGTVTVGLNSQDRLNYAFTGGGVSSRGVLSQR